MMKKLLSLASILFVLICIGAIAAQIFPLGGLWKSFEGFFRGFSGMFVNEGTLLVESTPEGASVYVDNALIGQTPLKKAFSNGSYEVRVMLSGFETQGRKVTIEKKNTAVVQVKLSKQYGKLEIRSTPSGATVLLDGVRQGQTTPFELQLPPGKYVVKIQKDRFYPYEETVVVEPSKTRPVVADMVRQLGRMVVETNPPGAKVYIGEDLIGTTPFTHEKPVGTYVMTIKKPEFRDKVIQATIAPDETLSITEDMTERSGGLKITTNPPGAEVHIDDVYMGETPLPIEKKPGKYRLTIRSKKYREVSEDVVIEDNITKNIHRDLDPVVVEFRIDSDPSRAKVWINGEDMGYTPAILHKEPGNYTVRVTKPGYRNYSEEVRIQEGAFLQLKAVLEAEGQQQ